jgi:hypothetical protein
MEKDGKDGLPKLIEEHFIWNDHYEFQLNNSETNEALLYHLHEIELKEWTFLIVGKNDYLE